MNAHKLCCEALVFNDNAIKLYEKFGFKQEGYFKDYLKRKNERIDCIAFALLDWEWQQIKDFQYKRIYER